MLRYLINEDGWVVLLLAKQDQESSNLHSDDDSAFVPTQIFCLYKNENMEMIQFFLL